MQTLLLIAALISLVVAFIRIGDTVAAEGFVGVFFGMVLIAADIVMRLVS